VKRFLIVLVVILLVGVVLAEAKVKFGNWDKWDEELPPADNESWYWVIPGLNEPRECRIGVNVVALLFSDIYFYGDKKGKTKASVVFYSSGMDVKKWDIPDASLALAAFPPKKGRMVIRTYKMEDRVFRFLEEWEIPFKENENVVPKDAKFRGIFGEWLRQISPILKPEVVLPELVIIRKNNFIITVFPEMIINVLKK